MTFDEKVYEVVKTIPRGYVTTYGLVAKAIGSPRAARAVGFALHRNKSPIIIPCHRVVKKNGAMAEGFVFGGPSEQAELLEGEGVPFTYEEKVCCADVTKCLFIPKPLIITEES